MHRRGQRHDGLPQRGSKIVALELRRLPLALGASAFLRDYQRVAHVYTRVYTSLMTASRAKLFRNGGSQAVRLPKECRFPDDEREVVVHREGRKIILEPADEWPSAFRACLGAWSEPIERPVAKPRDPF